jgi:hypothetical protein
LPALRKARPPPGGVGALSDRPSPVELLERPGALLTRSDLRELGLPRGAVDAVFRELEVIFLPGYSRGLVRREDYLAFLAEHSYDADRVRPT